MGGLPPPGTAAAAVLLLAFALLLCRLSVAHAYAPDSLEGCKRNPTDPGDSFFALVCETQGPCDDDDDETSHAAKGRATTSYCELEAGTPTPEPQKPRGMRGRGPARIDAVSLTPAIPCDTADLPRGQRSGLDTPGASRLWCPSAGRKTLIRLEGEVLREAGGGANLTLTLGMVGDLDNPKLEGEELSAALNDNICLRDTFCRVPLHTPSTLTITLDEARSYFPLRPAINHVAFAGRLSEALDIPLPDVNDTSIKHPLRDPYYMLRNQVSPAALIDLANTTDSASFTVSAGSLGDCMGRRRRGLGRQSTIDAEVSLDEALLSNDGICDFQWADSLAGQPPHDNIPTELGCTAALCVGPGDVNTTLVRYTEYGSHCALWEAQGNAEVVFAVTVTVQKPPIGGLQPMATLVAGSGAVPFDMPTPTEATAYTVHRGRGTTNTFWQEGARRDTRRATVRARARFGSDFTSPVDQASQPGTTTGAASTSRHQRRLENAFAPSMAKLDGAFLVCGALHQKVLPPDSTAPWIDLSRLPSAAHYWDNAVATGAFTPPGRRGPTQPPGVSSAVIDALVPNGGPLTVPTDMGHGGAKAFWSWIPRSNGSLAAFGRDIGMLGQSRASVFMHSLDRLDDVCAAGSNRTIAARYQPANADFIASLPSDTPVPKQPCAISSDLNTYAYHPQTVEWVRGMAPPGVSRADYGALPRSPYLPPPSLWDEGALKPNLYLARVLGTPYGLAYGNGQRLPFGVLHEETRVGSGAEELSMHRHGVDLQVEVDDSWLHIDNADHHERRANGTIYALRMLRAGSPTGRGSQCVRHAPPEPHSSATTDPYQGNGFIRLAYVTAGDTPFRAEFPFDPRPLRKRYRAEIQCDPSVGRFAVEGSRVDVDPGGYRATVRFMAAVGGPAGMVTALDHRIKLLPPHAPDLAAYFHDNNIEPPEAPSAAPHLHDLLPTGVCRVTLFSDEPESRHVQVGYGEVLPCAWKASPNQHTSGSGPLSVYRVPDDEEANAYIVDAIVIGSSAALGAIAILSIVVVLYVASHLHLKKQSDRARFINPTAPQDTEPADPNALSSILDADEKDSDDEELL